MNSGHSLRAGHATTAARAGAHERSIMAQTGHRSECTVRRYIRLGELFRENSAHTLGSMMAMWGASGAVSWQRGGRNG